MNLPVYILILIIIAIFPSCGNNAPDKSSSIEGDTLTSRSELLTLIDCQDYTAAIISDPWNAGKRLATYALIPHELTKLPSVPDGFKIIRTPLQRSVVYSSTNSAAITELGVLSALAAVSDGNYYAPDDTISILINQGRIIDIGNSMSPKLETLVEVEPDAILVSPYENAGHGILDAINTPVVECADYMETTPLGRAEWILFLGELYGVRDKARQLYNCITANYLTLRDIVSKSESPKPKILTEMLTSGVWYVPGGKSYMARMLSDAGADYPWSDNRSTGSLQLDVAAVIDKASDADIWIMRSSNIPTVKSLKSDNPIFKNIKALANGNVYNCDPSKTTFFNDIAFHPERILSDYINIFHPGIIENQSLRYFNKIAQE